MDKPSITGNIQAPAIDRKMKKGAVIDLIF
jgi:hypothetical protein